MYRCKHCTSNHHKAADYSEKNWYADEWLDWTWQPGLSEAQNDRAKYGEEEEGILSQAIEGEEDPHVAEEDVDGAEDSTQNESIYW